MLAARVAPAVQSMRSPRWRASGRGRSEAAMSPVLLQ
jgi:hypothetical protein